MIKYIFRSNYITDERGFAFTATATVISIILGLTLLFMANTVRTENVRVSELYSGQSAYWGAVADVQMAADMISTNGVGILPTITANFPNITVTSIDQNNMLIESQVIIGSDRGGAQRAASINITSPLYSIIQNVNGPPFDITGFARVDGGNLYIGNNVNVDRWWFFQLGFVGQSSLVNFFIPNGNTVNPAVPQGGNNYTVTNIPPLTMPGFDDFAYIPLLNYATGITTHDPSIGEYIGPFTLDNSTAPLGGIDLQDPNFTHGGLFGSGRTGIIVNGDLTIDGTLGSGTNIIANNSFANPGFIVVRGNVNFIGTPSFFMPPTFIIPNNVIIIASRNVTLRYTDFGTTGIPINQWQNFVNEISTLGDLTTPGFTFSGTDMFGQFNVFGSFASIGWTSRISGILYVPNSPYAFGTFSGAFPRFDGTFYVQRGASDQFSWAADINLFPNALLGRGLGGGLTQPSSIPWIVLPGTIREI